MVSVSEASDNNTFHELNNSFENIVIIIDSSASMTSEDPTTDISFIDRAKANALNIVQNIGRCGHLGVVSSGVVVNKTDMMSIDNAANKAELEKFIKDIVPDSASMSRKPVDIEKGLIEAEYLSNSTNGKKDIIVLSDGITPKKGEGFEKIENKVRDLKNKSIKIQFIQVILAYLKSEEPIRLYNELALAADGQVMVLNPDERVNFSHSLVEPDEPCLTPTLTPTQSIISSQTTTSHPSNQANMTQNEEKEIVKTPGFDGLWSVFIFFIIGLKYKR